MFAPGACSAVSGGFRSLEVRFNSKKDIGALVYALTFPSLLSFLAASLSPPHGNDGRLPQYEIQVPEGRVSPAVLRLQVRDGDAPFTAAWRAEFNISGGNEEGHFDIVTDPETNEGIVSVVKVKPHGWPHGMHTGWVAEDAEAGADP